MSNPRIIQNNGQRIYLRLVQGSGAVANLTTVGASGPATLSGGTLNIPNYTSGSAIPTSMPLASQVGILANGTDQTSALNTIFSNSSYEGIVMDFVGGGAVTISGTVNCQGKMIYFQPGSYFTGAGTLNNLVINSGDRQKCFDVTVLLTNCSVSNGKFSPWWFGLVPGNDSTYALQKTVDTINANQGTLRKCFIPSGSYTILQPIVSYRWDGSVYNQHTIVIEGEESFWSTTNEGTSLNFANISSGFAIGIHIGKGCEIRNLKLTGKFSPPFGNGQAFFNASFASFTDGVCQDTTFSPYSGIVVDPFTSIAQDVGYPSITSYNGTINFYRGSAGTGGSTGCIFEDLIINNFVLSFVTSVNGVTLNGELMKLTKIQIANCKAGIVGTQAQEKLNTVTHIACWGGTHTLFHFSGTGLGSYGQATPGHWIVDGVNIAGYVNRLIARNGTGYFPIQMNNIYAESLGYIGDWQGSQGDSIQYGTIDFVDLSITPYPNTSHFNAAGVTIKNLAIRYYDNLLHSVWLNGGNYEDCSFSGVPYGGYTTKNSSIGPLGASNTSGAAQFSTPKQSASRLSPSGKSCVTDSLNYIQGKKIELQSVDNTVFGLMQIANYPNQSASTISITSGVATITPPGGSADLARLSINKLIVSLTTGGVVGVVTEIGGSSYTVSYVPTGYVLTSDTLALVYPLTFVSFMGNITSGSPNISGVVLDFTLGSDFLNSTYSDGYVRIPGFYGYRAYTLEGRILSYNSGTGVIVMDRNASESATDFYFSSGNAFKRIEVMGDASGSGAAISNTEIFPQGGEYITNTPAGTGGGKVVNDITVTGYFNSTPQATWVPR